jgi:K+-transporting ATPase ATPase C chain
MQFNESSLLRKGIWVMMRKTLQPAIVLFATLTIVTGLIYPLLITGFSQLVFPKQANGSSISDQSGVIGSALIGQQFDNPKYFWGRLSATGAYPYNASASGGSNYGPMNDKLYQQAADRIAALKKYEPNVNPLPIPVDLVTASGSGLDPHISLAAARYQVARIAALRNLQPGQIEDLVNKNTEYPQFGLLGETRVNVLQLNLALDGLK